MLATVSVSSALEQFVEYQETGSEPVYWTGVMEFNAFRQAYWMLHRDTPGRFYDHSVMNELYALMLWAPKRAQGHIDGIVYAMSLILDGNHLNGFLRLSEVRHSAALR